VTKFPAAAKEVEAGAKHHLNVHWVLNEEPIAESEQFALSVMSYLLLGTSSSTLHKALMDSELGNTVTGGGFSDSL
jgi:Zn-dependent M16 (insulinase) family peptidase